MPDNEDGVRAMWSEDELDRALATLRADESPDERAFSRAKAELLAAANAGESPVEAVEPIAPARSRRRWGRWAAAVGTVAAVAATLLVVQFVRDDALPNAAAAARLNAAADNINSVDPRLSQGQYRYIATHAWWMTSMNEYAYLSENLIETWVPVDEKQPWLSRREVTGERKWVIGTEEKARADGMPIDETVPWKDQRAPCGDWSAEDEGRKPCTQKAGWQMPNSAFLASLPRDPQELYDRLLADVGDRGEAHIVTYVADVLRSGLVPADLRAALYRALGKVPGLEITEETANLDGQKGTSFGIVEDGQRHDVIIDPATGQFIGERQIAVEGSEYLPNGTLMGYTSVTTAVVDGIGVEPAK